MTKSRMWSAENEKLIYPTNGWYPGDCKGGRFTQYTGSKDKNGTEIYEGDVLKHFNKVYEVIRFYTLGYIGRTSKKSEEDIVLSLTSSDGEVIGNIYENAELLQEGK